MNADCVCYHPGSRRRQLAQTDLYYPAGGVRFPYTENDGGCYHLHASKSECCRRSDTRVAYTGEACMHSASAGACQPSSVASGDSSYSCDEDWTPAGPGARRGCGRARAMISPGTPAPEMIEASCGGGLLRVVEGFPFTRICLGLFTYNY